MGKHVLGVAPLDASRFGRWLQRAACAWESAPRRILRFRSAADYESCLRELRSAQRRHPALARLIVPLGIIRGLACPLPAAELPDAFRHAVTCEEDAVIRHSAASSLRPRVAPRKLRAAPGRRLRAAPRKVRLAPNHARAAPRRGSAADGEASPVQDGIPWGVLRIRAPEVWNRTTGYGVKVGVIDTGVDIRHPDLRHSLQQGVNLLQRSMPPYDDNGHGTHITGTIAAANRLRGMIGVAPRASVYPVKAFDAGGTAYVSDIVRAIDWCVRNRMDVINMSFGMNSRSSSLEIAVAGAWRAGLMIVASAGNDSKRGSVDFPARSGHSIAVGALDRRGRVASFTNRSREIDIYAPGERIYSCWPRGRHREMSGTSMATSHVTGAIALLLAYRPGLTPAQIIKIVRTSARPLSGRNAPQTAGMLDVVRMLETADAMF
jgi:hypothetical protein